MSIEVIILGSGSPLPHADRAGPATLVRAGGMDFLFDCGRGVLMRATAAGVAVPALAAQFPLLGVDRLQTQAAIAFLLVKHGVSCSVTFGPGKSCPARRSRTPWS